MSLNYQSDSCPFASRANICFKNVKLSRGNYQPIVPQKKHSIKLFQQNLERTIPLLKQDFSLISAHIR